MSGRRIRRFDFLLCFPLELHDIIWTYVSRDVRSLLRACLVSKAWYNLLVESPLARSISRFLASTIRITLPYNPTSYYLKLPSFPCQSTSNWPGIAKLFHLFSTFRIAVLGANNKGNSKSVFLNLLFDFFSQTTFRRQFPYPESLPTLFENKSLSLYFSLLPFNIKFETYYSLAYQTVIRKTDLIVIVKESFDLDIEDKRIRDRTKGLVQKIMIVFLLEESQEGDHEQIEIVTSYYGTSHFCIFKKKKILSSDTFLKITSRMVDLMIYPKIAKNPALFPNTATAFLLESLPDELKIIIFSFLPRRTSLLFQLVSKHYRSLVFSSYLYSATNNLPKVIRIQRWNRSVKLRRKISLRILVKSRIYVSIFAEFEMTVLQRYNMLRERIVLRKLIEKEISEFEKEDEKKAGFLDMINLRKNENKAAIVATLRELNDQIFPQLILEKIVEGIQLFLINFGHYKHGEYNKVTSFVSNEENDVGKPGSFIRILSDLFVTLTPWVVQYTDY
eukprot:TRINITY_DN11052_c0_g4_i1.p1 TRINITY_DN11052_c0_g4~~TRINITY_DN11052_c0_g4_i1.p1  ORF type:complete len:503 (-),score=63.84 TRINITY_DN11052_c0_g4_i1:339-1847(-)